MEEWDNRDGRLVILTDAKYQLSEAAELGVGGDYPDVQHRALAQGYYMTASLKDLCG